MIIELVCLISSLASDIARLLIISDIPDMDWWCIPDHQTLISNFLLIENVFQECPVGSSKKFTGFHIKYKIEP